MPSRPGEFHPEPLTNPDVARSRHPARATARRLPPSLKLGFLPLPVEQPFRTGRGAGSACSASPRAQLVAMYASLMRPLLVNQVEYPDRTVRF